MPLSTGKLPSSRVRHLKIFLKRHDVTEGLAAYTVTIIYLNIYLFIDLLVQKHKCQL